jgi:hypothetical protein
MKRPSRFRPLASLSSLFGRPAAQPRLREEGMFELARTRLANGLKVWVKPRPSTGTVVLLLQVPVGARHETKQNNGVSHFLEHMLFSGTARWSEQEVLEVIRRRGGEAIARTALEDTVFWLHLKADDLEVGLEWLAEVVFRPQLDAEKFKKERRVIIQEKGGRIAGPNAMFIFRFTIRKSGAVLLDKKPGGAARCNCQDCVKVGDASVANPLFPPG